MLLRFAGGARGTLWASQVAPGNENGLAIRVYGEKAPSRGARSTRTNSSSPASVSRPWPSVAVAPRSVRQPPMPPASLLATRKVIWKASRSSTAMLQPNCGRGRLRLLWIR